MLNKRSVLALWCLTLPIIFLLPYAFFVERFRVLLWVWESAYLPFWITLAVISVTALVAAVLIYRLYHGAMIAYAICILMAIGQPSYLAMREHRHFLLVLLFALLCIQVAIFEHIRSVLLQPYYFSGRRWWESYPKAIPNLHAILYFSSDKQDPIPVRLSNIGRAGCYVFSADRPLQSRPKQVAIRLGDSTILERSVESTVVTDDKFGMGLRFLSDGGTSDWSKDLEDYLGHLRRSGYVET